MKRTDTYEWVLLEDFLAKIGITKKAQQEIGEIVHIQFPKIGSVVKKGEELLVLESTKSAIDTYSPITGEIISINTPLMEKMHLLNDDPEGHGWLIQIKAHDVNQYHLLENYK